MAFIQPCFIRKNTPELRIKLDLLLIKQNDFDDNVEASSFDFIIHYKASAELTFENINIAEDGTMQISKSSYCVAESENFKSLKILKQ